MKRLSAIFLCAMLSLAVFAACSGQTEQRERVKEISIFSRPVPEKIPGQKVNWLDVSSFVCYYGQYDDKLTNFDVAICESKNLGAEGIRKLKDAGVYTICYLTVGEDDSLRVGDGLGFGGFASYYIYENGMPKVNPNWNSYFVDAGNPVWQARVLEQAKKILDMGADGIFLDTIDTVDVDSSTTGGMVELIKKLDETFPDAKLVANRGFSVLEYVAPYLDGLMFESFNTTWNFETGKSDVYAPDSSGFEYNVTMAVNTINKNRQYYYFPVFALDYVNDFEIDYMSQTHMDRSWTYDFIPYLTTSVGLNVINVPTVKPQSARGSLALKGEGNIAQEAGSPNGDTSAENLAYVKNGCAVEVDSYYSSDYRGNKTAAVNDGFIKPSMYWAKRSWASAEEKYEPYRQDHYIVLTLPEPKSVSKMNVHFECDQEVYYSSRELVVELFVDGEWTQVAKMSDIPSQTKNVTLTWTPQSAQKIRLRQPAGMGAEFRPGIMWIMEVELYA